MRALLLILLLLLCPGACFASDTANTPYTKVRVITDSDGYTPGATIWAGIHFQLEPGWHIYWKNPGDSGSAPKIRVEPHDQISAGELLWPAPKRIPVGHLMNFGYEHEVVLPLPLIIADDANGELILKVDAEWLVCKEDCVPGTASLALTLREQTQIRPSRNVALIRSFRDRVPLPLTLDELEASLQDDIVELTLPNALPIASDLIFIPETPGVIENSAPQIALSDGESTVLTMKRSTSKLAPPRLSGLLFAGPTVTSVTFRLLNASSAMSPPPEADRSLAIYILFAFLGGIILNLMPCVFPVIGIKVLSLIEEAELSGRSRILYGLAYSFGVLISLWGLFAVVLAAQALGTELGWGFQLQNPFFVAALSLLFFMLGFNFLGVVEFSLPTVFGKTGSRTHLGEAVFSGMLTTIVATPCTAPFMGTSIAFGLQSSPVVGFAIFTALALGLASPYLLFVVSPRALGLLPKPGNWMVLLKQILAFPLFGATIWLAWVLSHQTGADGVMRLLCALLIIGFAIWVRAAYAHLKASRKQRMRALTVFWALVALSILMMARLQPVSSAMQQQGSSAFVDAYQLSWEPYDRTALDRHIAAGRTVFIDFTATWCVTCQVNKALVFGSSEVRKVFAERNVVLMRGDWTSQDPKITEAIHSYGKAGVPLNVFYAPNKAPHIFPTVLTPSIVLEKITD